MTAASMLQKRWDITELKRSANGRWQALLPVLGVDAAYLTGKGAPCPICRAGRDRFRFDNLDGNGTWICNHCSAGDGIALAMRVNGWTLPEALDRIAANVGAASAVIPQAKISPDRVKAQMRRISRQRRPLTDVEATLLWWVNRVGELPDCRDLYAVESLAYQDGKAGQRTFHPGMIAVFRDAGGNPANMHRTYLTPDGRKAAVAKPRKVMGIDLPNGGAVRLYAFDDVLGIAEGIETAVAVTIMTGIPCWGAINSTMLRAWVPPPAVRIVIFADHDPEKQGKRAGQEAAAALAGRLLLEGRQVEIRVPPTEGDDWDDVLMRKLGREIAA